MRNLALLLALFAFGCASDSPNELRADVRVMTWNVQHGLGADGRIDLERVADVILAYDPDFVTVQEIDRGVERSGRRLIDDELSELTGMQHVFGKTTEWQGGDFGNAVFSRYEIEWSRNDLLRLDQGAEQRGALQVGARVNGRPLVIVSTHLANRGGEGEQLLNVADLLDVVGAHSYVPVIIGGDFNAAPGSPPYNAATVALEDVWPHVSSADGFTEPSSSPDRRIDYLFLYRGGGLVPVGGQVVDTRASDHRPLLVDFAHPKRTVVPAR